MSSSRASPPLSAEVSRQGTAAAELQLLAPLIGQWKGTFIVKDAKGAESKVGIRVQRSWALEKKFIQSDLQIDGPRTSRSLGFIAFDPVLKTYQSVQLDADTGTIVIQHATYDRDRRQLTFRGQAPDIDSGRLSPTRSVLDMSNPDTHRFSSYRDAGSGKETTDYTGTFERVK